MAKAILESQAQVVQGDDDYHQLNKQNAQYSNKSGTLFNTF